MPQAVSIAYENQRLAIPPQCPPRIAMLVRQCMATDPTERPNFGDIVNFLTKFIIDGCPGAPQGKEADIAAFAERGFSLQSLTGTKLRREPSTSNRERPPVSSLLDLQRLPSSPELSGLAARAAAAPHDSGGSAPVSRTSTVFSSLASNAGAELTVAVASKRTGNASHVGAAAGAGAGAGTGAGAGAGAGTAAAVGTEFVSARRNSMGLRRGSSARPAGTKPPVSGPISPLAVASARSTAAARKGSDLRAPLLPPTGASSRSNSVRRVTQLGITNRTTRRGSVGAGTPHRVPVTSPSSRR